MKKGTFSNGREIEYHGNKNLIFGWCLMNRETGRTIKTGVSQNARAAYKAAETKIPKPPKITRIPATQEMNEALLVAHKARFQIEVIQLIKHAPQVIEA